jgi:hypothetical protein
MTFTPAQDKKRNVVVGYCQFQSPKPLLASKKMRPWLTCDGFGKVTPQWLHENCFDWSHVRDSSPEAIDACYALLVAWGLVEEVK